MAADSASCEGVRTCLTLMGILQREITETNGRRYVLFSKVKNSSSTDDNAVTARTRRHVLLLSIGRATGAGVVTVAAS